MTSTSLPLSSNPMASQSTHTVTQADNPDRSDRPDAIAILREEVIAAAIAHGADRCEELADNLVRRFVYRLGGAAAYIRNQKAAERARVAEEIRRRFNGCNATELAREYGMTARNVRYILSRLRGRV